MCYFTVTILDAILCLVYDQRSW